MKRVFDFLAALTALVILAPALAFIAAVIWLEDRRFPLFLALRVARGGGDFRMVKFRTMIPDAWKSGVNSTASGDAWLGIPPGNENWRKSFRSPASS